MAMIAALKFDDAVPPGVTARKADSAHRGFGSGAYQPYLLNGRHQFTQQFRDLQFRLGGRPKSQAVFCCGTYRLNHLRVGMPQNQRSPGADVVYVGFAIRVPYIGPLTFPEKYRRTTYRLEGANRRVDASGNEFLRLLEQLLVT